MYQGVRLTAHIRASGLSRGVMAAKRRIDETNIVSDNEPQSTITRVDGSHESRLRDMIVSSNTFLFADLCDYTEHTFRNGDEFAAELAVGFHLLVRELAASESCEVVKAIGDAVMVRAARVADAVRLAQRIHARGEELGYPPLRAGIDTGPAVPKDGDWYGTTVNQAARVAEAADPGELLLTERALAALTPSRDVRIVARGVCALKGLPEALLHAAYAGPSGGGDRVVAGDRTGQLACA